uniref:Uncharacterized protein n=1 Tax=Glossina austeni TaxID=7395 RepID=A0A1A9VE49_GLOAU
MNKRRIIYSVASRLKWKQFSEPLGELVYKQLISSLEKLLPLKCNLIGEANRLIRHLSLPEDQDLASYKILHERDLYASHWRFGMSLNFAQGELHAAISATESN